MIGSMIPIQSRAAIEISRLWCMRDFTGWSRAVDACHARGLWLMDVIAERHRWYRDACALYGFDHRLPAWHVAREIRVDWAHGAPVLIQVSGTPARGGERERIKRTTTQVPEVAWTWHVPARVGGESRPS